MNPLHSDYCNCICPEGLSYDKLEQTLNRVRMVHIKTTRNGVTFCAHCLDPNVFDEFALWPCDTMAALAGEEIGT